MSWSGGQALTVMSDSIVVVITTSYPALFNYLILLLHPYCGIQGAQAMQIRVHRSGIILPLLQGLVLSIYYRGTMQVQNLRERGKRENLSLFPTWGGLGALNLNVWMMQDKNYCITS